MGREQDIWMHVAACRADEGRECHRVSLVDGLTMEPKSRRRSVFIEYS